MKTTSRTLPTGIPVKLTHSVGSHPAGTRGVIVKRANTSHVLALIRLEELGHLLFVPATALESG
jgi:hypothetical protein